MRKGSLKHRSGFPNRHRQRRDRLILWKRGRNSWRAEDFVQAGTGRLRRVRKAAQSALGLLFQMTILVDFGTIGLLLAVEEPQSLPAEQTVGVHTIAIARWRDWLEAGKSSTSPTW
jgi:hypothetical protein